MIEVYNEDACIKRSHELTKPHLIISITDPTAPLPMFSELSHPAIRFCFMDLEFDAAAEQIDSGLIVVRKAGRVGYRGPDGIDAQNLAKVIRIWDQDMPFLIHCAYGMSRSVAVGLAASLYWDAPLQFDRARACPNRRLSRMLDAELGLGGKLVEEALKYNGF